MALKAELTPSFKQTRKRIQWYISHENEYNNLEEVGKSKKKPFKRFRKATRTRWNSFIDELAGDLYNTPCIEEQRKQLPHVPAPIDESVAELHEQAIGVFTPHMVGTKILEGDSEFVGASAYLPTWKGIRHHRPWGLLS